MKRKHLTQGLLAATLLLATAGTAFAEPHQDEYDRGRNAVFEERWDDVREIFDDYARRFPLSPHVDDAQYWLGMALYELGQQERSYEVLKRLHDEHEDSPWLDDARVIMVRCAETILKSAAGRGGGFSQIEKLGVPSRSNTNARNLRMAEYEAFIERSTQDSNSKVQLLAIDTMLLSRPEKAPELLPRLNDTSGSPEATHLVLDRYFGADQVKVTLEDPGMGLTEENVDIMVRQEDKVVYLTLSEAIELIRSPSSTTASGKAFQDATIAEIEERLLKTEKGLRLPSVSAGPGPTTRPDSDRLSAIVKVIDGEVHYYRNDSETTRIVVLRREAGFNDENIRVFVETASGMHSIGLDEARGLGVSENHLGLEPSTIRYLKAALAIIEIDLSKGSGTAGTN